MELPPEPQICSLLALFSVPFCRETTCLPATVLSTLWELLLFLTATFEVGSFFFFFLGHTAQLAGF